MVQVLADQSAGFGGEMVASLREALGDAAISFAVEAGRITRIFAVRNPAKLGGIDVGATLTR